MTEMLRRTRMAVNQAFACKRSVICGHGDIWVWVCEDEIVEARWRLKENLSFIKQTPNS